MGDFLINLINLLCLPQIFAHLNFNKSNLLFLNVSIANSADLIKSNPLRFVDYSFASTF